MDWRNELYNWEESPPEDSWKKISLDLDNEFLSVKKRFSTYEELPPANMWDRIVSKLNVGKAVVIPLPSKWNRKRFYRMAVAAAIAALVITGVEFLFFRTKTKEASPVQNAGVTAKTDTSLARPESANPITANAGGLKNIISKIIYPKKNSVPVAGADATAEQTAEITPAVTAEEDNSLPENQLTVDQISGLTDKYDLNTYSKRVKNQKGEETDDVNITDLMNSYFHLTDGSGSDVRVSSKFKSLKGVLGSNPKTEDILGMILSGNDYWNSVISIWQKKLVNSGFIPSPENFMDIHELMKLMQEDSK
ncbi:MAG: hypothetical protein C5B52_06980 [Bacteroidetes bacterium]|nr:MAG: hypothetical protein C5B52_06980 [Bacteroidota bacterium]